MTSAKFIVLWVLVVSCLVQEMSCNGGDRGPPANRIREGEEASPGEFPFMVALEMFSVPFGWSFICGGSIIDEQHVLTAAHCVTNAGPAPSKPESLRVKVGCHKLSECNTTYQVAKVMVHHEWVDVFKGNDIAVLKLVNKMKFVGSVGLKAVAAVDLAPRDDSCCEHGKTQLTITGWGNINNTHSTDVLLKAKIDSLPLEECKRFWLENAGRVIGDDVVCTRTRAKGTHRGDSGGPLLHGTKLQVGITSFSDKLVDPINVNNVFTKVAPFRAWIEQCISYGNCPSL